VRTNERRLFQTVRAQHENRRAMLVDEDRVDNSSDVCHCHMSLYSHWRFYGIYFKSL